MANIERIAKTPKAWEALSRPDLIDKRAHALLLMANGRRSDQELSVLMGGDVSELAVGLRQQGYLQKISVLVEVEDEEGPSVTRPNLSA